MFDLIIIGAGPAGLAVAIEAQKAGLTYLVIEKGAITNSILRYPTEMKFFSTAPLLEIGGVPFSTPNANPTRSEGLSYYRIVADHYELAISLYDPVASVKRDGDAFLVTSASATRRAAFVVVATGYFDNPHMMEIPGEDLPNVSHYYTEGHPFYNREVIVIGSQNSSAEASLDLLQHKARVTMIIRASKLGESVKYWLKPALENRIKDGSIKALFETTVERIEPDRIIVADKQGSASQIKSDFVFALTGYQPNVQLLRSFGVEVDPHTLIPSYHTDTFETNISGLFIAGSVACGCETGTIFIENGRLHAYTIIGVIKRRLAETKKTRVIE